MAPPIYSGKRIPRTACQRCQPAYIMWQLRAEVSVPAAVCLDNPKHPLQVCKHSTHEGCNASVLQLERPKNEACATAYSAYLIRWCGKSSVRTLRSNESRTVHTGIGTVRGANRSGKSSDVITRNTRDPRTRLHARSIVGSSAEPSVLL